MPNYDDDDDVKTSTYDDDDDDGWNSGDPIVELNCPGVFKGRISQVGFTDKNDGTGQLWFRIVPTEVVSAKLPAGLAAEDISAAVQRFSMYLSKDDATTLSRARELCAGLGSETAAKDKRLRLTKWVEEVADTSATVYFRLAQPKARPNYPNVDEAGNPIYQVAQLSAKPIKPKL